MVLCLIMSATLWRAPVPLVHRHSETADISHLNERLAAHLAAYHTHQRQRDWHLHLVLPWDLADGTDSQVPDEPRPRPDDMALTCLVAGELASGTAIQITGPGQLSVSSVALDQQAFIARTIKGGNCGGFLQTYTSVVPVRALTGVALC
jgi:hypothetical protein